MSIIEILEAQKHCYSCKHWYRKLLLDDVLIYCEKKRKVINSFINADKCDEYEELIQDKSCSLCFFSDNDKNKEEFRCIFKSTKVNPNDKCNFFLNNEESEKHRQYVRDIKNLELKEEKKKPLPVTVTEEKKEIVIKRIYFDKEEKE